MRSQDAVNRLIAKVEKQAMLEGAVLSDLEVRMLRWSEVEPDGLSNPSINEKFDEEYDTDDYEQKISGLILRAYEREKYDSRQKAEWEGIKSDLDGHDYYVLVMLEQALPSNVTSWRFQSRSSLRDNLIYLAIGLGAVGMLLYYVLTRLRG